MDPLATFLFAEDFDQSVQRPPEPVEAPPELYTAGQMAACRDMAWQEGHAAGLGVRDAAGQQDIRQYLAAIEATIRTTRSDLAARADATAQELCQLLCAMFASALPVFCARHGRAEIQAIAAEILPALVGEPNVRVLIPPAHLSNLQKHLADLDPDLVRSVQLQTDAQMGPSDIVIRWDQGDAIRDGTQIWNNITSILDPIGLTMSEPAQRTTAREPAHAE